MPQQQPASTSLTLPCISNIRVFSRVYWGEKSHVTTGAMKKTPTQNTALFFQGHPTKFLCIFNVKFDPQKIRSHLMNLITPIYGNSLERNITIFFPASLLPPPSPPKKITGSPSTNKPQCSYQLSKGETISPHHEALVESPLSPTTFNRHLCVRSWKNSGRAIASLRTLKTSGTSAGWFWCSFNMEGGGERGSCWFGWLENKEMLICIVCIYIVICMYILYLHHLCYTGLIWRKRKAGWKSKKVRISSSQESNTFLTCFAKLSQTPVVSGFSVGTSVLAVSVQISLLYK